MSDVHGMAATFGKMLMENNPRMRDNLKLQMGDGCVFKLRKGPLIRIGDIGNCFRLEDSMAVTLSRNVRVRYVFMLDEITALNQLAV